MDDKKAPVKQLRQRIDGCIQQAELLQKIATDEGKSSRAISISITKLEEAKMWGGKRLEELDPTDYPVELRDKAE